MYKKSVLFALALTLLLFALTKAVSAQPRVPGVAPGDWIRYEDIVFSWNSTDPDAKPPGDFKDMNETQWLLGLVTGVSGTNVSLSTTQHFVNGTDKFEDEWIDVATGQSKNMTFVLIAANLNVGDSIYTSPEYSEWKINETIPVNYPGGPRDTNHLNITMSFNITIPPPFPIVINFSMSINEYWDRATGVITEMNQHFYNQTNAFVTEWSFTFKATSSNIWVIPEFTTTASFLMIFTAVTTLVALHKRRLTLRGPIT